MIDLKEVTKVLFFVVAMVEKKSFRYRKWQKIIFFLSDDENWLCLLLREYILVARPPQGQNSRPVVLYEGEIHPWRLRDDH